MTTKQQSGSQPHPRAKANPSWGMGYSLVLTAAVVAAYLITAPRAVTPGISDAAPVGSVSFDPLAHSALDYLAVHARLEAGSGSVAPHPGANP